MKKANYLLILAASIVSLQNARATTVIPPTFDELVDQAEVIFQGNVTRVRSEWVGEGAQRHIVSYISFNVEDNVKGNAGKTYTIRMFGGTVDGETMAASDAPKFKVGDKDILFVQNNGSQFVPLVGIMHGRFHVKREQSGQEVVTTNDGEPVKNVARLGREHAAEASSAERTFSPDDLKAAVKSRLNRVEYER